MAAHLNLTPGFANHTFFVDEKGGALNSHVLAPIEALLHPHTIGLAERALGVGNEGEGKVVLGLELVVPGDAVLETPTMVVLACSNSGDASAKAIDSLVQPDVMSLG